MKHVEYWFLQSRINSWIFLICLYFFYLVWQLIHISCFVFSFHFIFATWFIFFCDLMHISKAYIFRPLSGAKSFEDDVDLEDGKVEKERDKPLRYDRPLKLNNQAFLSGLAYCLSSCGMILVNKVVLSGYDFNAGISLMLYQV